MINGTPTRTRTADLLITNLKNSVCFQSGLEIDTLQFGVETEEVGGFRIALFPNSLDRSIAWPVLFPEVN